MLTSMHINSAILFLPAVMLLVGGGCGDGSASGGRTDGAGGEGGAGGSAAMAGAAGGADASAGMGGTTGGGTATGGGSGVGGSAGSGVGGSAGSGGAGVGGSGGKGDAGIGGAAGSGGRGGNGGNAGTGGTSGTGGTGGIDAGTGGAGGAAGTGGTSTCTNPVFVTSDTNGGWSNGGYYVHNNMWNSSAGLGPETLSACAYNNWYVVSNQTNSAGAVKTYPNVHKDYSNVAISTFNVITSTFAEASPHVGIYNVAYDIWTNGVATSGSTEFMIWTENYNQVPAGSKVMTTVFGGRTYDVWKTSNNQYIAFVPTIVFTSGTVDLLEIFKWTISQGWLPSNSTLGQICFGVEIVSTNGSDATFYFTDFSITTN